MNTNKIIITILTIILIIVCLFNCKVVNDLEEKTLELIELTDVEPELIIVDSLVYDTVFVERYDSVRLTKCQFDTITLNDTTIIIDSVDVLLPIELKHYNDTLAETAFSFDILGYNCELKDLYIQNLIVCPDQEKPLKTKPFGIGVSLGLGATKNGFSPYIGIGVSYNIFQF
jgi:hypothetical protein